MKIKLDLKFHQAQKLVFLLTLCTLMTFGVVTTAFATTLPPRPDGITVGGSSIVEIERVSGMSARIVLSSTEADPDDWTVVQWQTAEGTWIDVTGWRGHFLSDGSVVWWVGDAQLGQENFRWVIYENADRQLIKMTTQQFDLPTTADEVVLLQLR